VMAYFFFIVAIVLTGPAAGLTVLAAENQSHSTTATDDRGGSGSAVAGSHSTFEKASSDFARDMSAKTDAAPPRASRSRPTWVDQGAERVGSEYRLPVAIGPYASPLECEARLPAAVEAAIDDYVELILGPEARGRVKVPWSFVVTNLLRERYMESRLFQLTSTQQREMHTLHVLLTFDHNANQYLRQIWRFTQGTMNLVRFGTFFGIAVWTLAVVWGYLRLDLTFGGRYRLPLGAAAGLLLVLPWIILAILPLR